MDGVRGISRRAAIIKAAKAGAYTAPAILSVTAARGVVAASPATVSLTLTKAVNPLSGLVPTITTFTLTLTNNGPVTASGVMVTDLLNAAAFTYQSSTASLGTYVPATGVWSIPSLAVGIPAILTINVLALFPGPQPNTATLTASTPPNANLANNTATATFTGVQPVLVG